MENFQAYIQQCFTNMPDHARVWVYQANQTLSEAQEQHIKNSLQQFVSNWNNHGTPLKGEGMVLFQHFIVLSVDESEIGASGCSIDSSMRLIKNLENELGISFTDRMKLAYLDNGLHLTNLQDLPSTVHEGTWVFNNLVANVGEWKNAWIAPLQKTWVRRFLKANNPIFSSIK